jgi:arylsulfatase A
MKKIVFTVLSFCLFLVTASAQKKPNVIFILADDLGYAEISCNGADNYKTPNIDKLAENGLRFDHCYVGALCGPSRAMIMTGRYPFRTGATNQDNTGRFTPQAETMIPKMMKEAGYVSASFGKWGQLPLTPADFGFDQYLAFTGSGIYWNTQPKGKNYLLNGEKVPLKDGEYMPEVMHQQVVKFLAENKKKPFFLYYPLSHVHNDILPTPDSKPDSKNLYKDNIEYMDKMVGKLLNVVDSLSLRKNTIIIFIGDNGTAGAKADNATINGRRIIGQKGSMQEGGGLVPLIVSWKGKTPKHQISNSMVDATDFFPTFMNICGINLTQNKLDGESILPELSNKPDPNHRKWIFNQLGNKWYVREQNWKLNQSGELFDMSKAPFEELLVEASTTNSEAIDARQRLQKILDQLNPAGGILDDGDGSGRHANKKNKKDGGD